MIVAIPLLIVSVMFLLHEFFVIERENRLKALVMVGSMLTLFVGGIYLLA